MSENINVLHDPDRVEISLYGIEGIPENEADVRLCGRCAGSRADEGVGDYAGLPLYWIKTYGPEGEHGGVCCDECGAYHGVLD